MQFFFLGQHPRVLARHLESNDPGPILYGFVRPTAECYNQLTYSYMFIY